METRGLSFYIFQDSGYERKWYFHIVKFPGMKISENSLKENLYGLVLYFGNWFFYRVYSG